MSVTSASHRARDRVRREMTGEILSVARQHLARDGAAALSLRSIARDLGLAPSALYRYFEGRAALLSALILASYESLAEWAEAAAERAARLGGSDAARFTVVPQAIRSWALERPHEWGLLFGTPVPGYQAPEGTVVSYTRIAAATVRPVAEASAAGRLEAPERPTPVPEALAGAVAPIGEALFPDLATDAVVRVVRGWTTMIGAISLEVFGHWRGALLDPTLFFERTIADIGDAIGLR
jgi:AcrR family transcriptional regulator